MDWGSKLGLPPTHCPEERSAGYDPLKAEGALNPRYRTVNLNSTPGSVNDIWKYNPWRA